MIILQYEMWVDGKLFAVLSEKEYNEYAVLSHYKGIIFKVISVNVSNTKEDKKIRGAQGHNDPMLPF